MAFIKLTCPAAAASSFKCLRSQIPPVVIYGLSVGWVPWEST